MISKQPMTHPPFLFHLFTSLSFSSLLMRGFHIGFLLIDKIEVPEVDDGVKKIGGDKDRVHLSNGIGQKDQSPSQAEIPEGDWDDTLLSLLRGNPLNDEPHGKHRLTEEPKKDPKIQLEFWIS